MGLTGGRFRGGATISTGHFSLDFALKYGALPTNADLDLDDCDPSPDKVGIPLGILVEFSGNEGSGKSSLAYRVCGNAQKMGYTVAWIDAENSFSEDLSEINGCDSSKMITSKTVGTAEDYLQMIKALMRVDQCPFEDENGKMQMVDPPKVIVVDSVASLTPAAIAEREVGQQTMALLASLLSDQLKDISNLAIEKGVLIIFINQLRESLNMYGAPTGTPGGRALKHNCSVRIELKSLKQKEKMIYDMDDRTGTERLIAGQSAVSIRKNKLGKPFIGSFDIPIYYEKVSFGIASFAFLAARQMKIISVRINTFSWKSQGVKVEGKSEFINYIKENDLLNVLIKEITDAAVEAKVILPPEIVRYSKEPEYLAYLDSIKE
jgi:recombination protein RecA